MSDQPSPSAVDGVLGALTDVIRSAASPEQQQAQLLLLRRLAVEGSVIPSRIPAPRNITEVGGYLNQLTSLGLTDMRTQMLSAALGLAGPTLPLGWTAAPPPLRLVEVANDRPDGATAPTVRPLVPVRSDLARPLQAALAALHAHGGRLPLWAPTPGLPDAAQTAPDPMVAVGRVLWVAPTATLVDPTTDPVTLGRAAADTGTNLRLAVRVAPGSPGSSSLDWTGVVWDRVVGGYVQQALGPTDLVAMEDVLAGTGFTPARPAGVPTGRGDLAWARLVDVAGLVPGVTRLGDELRLLYTPDAIAASALAGATQHVWDGTAFVP